MGTSSGFGFDMTQAYVFGYGSDESSETGIRCRSRFASSSSNDSGPTHPTISQVPKIRPDLLLIRAIFPRVLVCLPRISHVLAPESIRSIQGDLITSPFIRIS